MYMYVLYEHMCKYVCGELNMSNTIIMNALKCRTLAIAIAKTARL